MGGDLRQTNDMTIEEGHLDSTSASTSGTYSAPSQWQGGSYKDATEKAKVEYRQKKRSMLNELSISETARREQLLRHLLVATTVSFVSILAFVLVYLYLRSQTPPSPSFKSTPNTTATTFTTECGTSPAEAISLGCTFDQLSMLWLPPDISHLFDTQFRAHGGPAGWTYWTDQTGQHPIANISMHPGQYWTTNREHLTHCAFHLMRVSDALRRSETRSTVGREYDFKVYNQDHNRHCAMMLMNASMMAPAEGFLDEVGTSSYIWYGSTLPVDG